MSHILFRNKIITYIENAMREFSDASKINPPGLQGEIREIAAKNLFKPLLPEGFKIQHRGKVIDAWGNQSKEIDLIIYNKRILPSIMYGEEDRLFPSESSFYAIEVKSTVDAKAIKDSHEKAKILLNSIKYLPGKYINMAEVTHEIKKIVPVLFAFTSDLSNSGKTEIQRYQDYLSRVKEDPKIIVICVIGKGYWWLRENDGKWIFHKPTKDHDEAIDFLSGVINTLNKTFHFRGYPSLGNYLMLPDRGELI